MAKRCAKAMIYLASPYSHPDPLVREERYLRASWICVQLLQQGRWVYSPIVHCHEMAKTWDLPRDVEFWKQYNLHMLDRASELLILRILGWTESKGIAIEKAYAESHNISVSYF